LIGEVCHFIDTCAALVGSPALEVQAVGAGPNERLLSERLGLALSYADGSIATISYAPGGPPAMEKERVEVWGRGRAATIVDFRKLVIDGRSHPLKGQDKGHLEELRAFKAAVDGDKAPSRDFIESSRTTLVAADTLRLGRPEEEP
jgi:hypothetical protein